METKDLFAGSNQPSERKSKSALPGSRGANVFNVDPWDLCIIGHDTDHRRGDHPLYDAKERVEQEPDRALIDSIKKEDIMEPVKVSKALTDAGERYPVIFGRMRTKAARIANEELAAAGEDRRITVPCMLEKGSEQALALRMVTENMIRRDYSPLDRAELVENLDRMGTPHEDIAQAFGWKTKKTVKHHLQLMSLSTPVKKAVQAGELSADAAAPLAEFDHSIQKQKLEELREASGGRRITKASTSRKVARAQGAEPSTAPGKRLARKVVKLDEDHEDGEVLSVEFRRGVRWVLGDLSPRAVKGLADRIRECGGDV